VKVCSYRVRAADGLGLVCCGQPITHTALLETIGEEGPQSRAMDVCEYHSRGSDVIEAFTFAELDEMDNS
jgi:hypothetical protein